MSDNSLSDEEMPEKEAGDLNICAGNKEEASILADEGEMVVSEEDSPGKTQGTEGGPWPEMSPHQMD
ncbi:hypothetical protein R1flu_001537 [Riccia fluitans]|uniref:Uncharacterized protein n=1 Tax=Riccia fluitans TaxID=41844 RepID=A0ABD1Y6V1_9MARC